MNVEVDADTTWFLADLDLAARAGGAVTLSASQLWDTLKKLATMTERAETAEREVERLNTVAADLLEALIEARSQLAEKHDYMEDNDGEYCEACQVAWPCPPMEAIDKAIADTTENLVKVLPRPECRNCAVELAPGAAHADGCEED